MSRDFESGSSQYLSNTNAVLTATPLTMACWFKPESASSNQCLISLGVSGNTNNRHNLSLIAGVGVRMISRTTSNAEATTSANFSTGVWQHACGVVASSTDRRAYLNGGNEGTDATDRTPAGINSTFIGAQHNASPSTFTDGLIAEAAIWNVALNASEIAVLARGVSPLRIRPGNLKFYAPLFGVGSPEPDYIGGFDMTLNAAPTQAAHAPVMSPFFRADWFGAFTAAAPGGSVGLPVISEGGYSPIFGGMVVR
jgi:hypothetical protein